MYSKTVFFADKSYFLLSASCYRTLWSTKSTQPAYRIGRERELPLSASSKTARCRINCCHLHHTIVMWSSNHSHHPRHMITWPRKIPQQFRLQTSCTYHRLWNAHNNSLPWQQTSTIPLAQTQVRILAYLVTMTTWWWSPRRYPLLARRWPLWLPRSSVLRPCTGGWTDYWWNQKPKWQKLNRYKIFKASLIPIPNPSRNIEKQRKWGLHGNKAFSFGWVSRWLGSALFTLSQQIFVHDCIIRYDLLPIFRAWAPFLVSFPSARSSLIFYSTPMS